MGAFLASVAAGHPWDGADLAALGEGGADAAPGDPGADGGGGLLGALGALASLGTYRGSSPAPFDAVDPARLASADEGSHPLALVGVDELVRPASEGLEGGLVLDAPALVGGELRGRISVTAVRPLRARSASVRLVAVRLAEAVHSRTEGKDRTVRWVQADGRLVETLPFREPALPLALDAGQAWTGEFLLPAPRLGPPTTHAGSALVAWALQAHWDVPNGFDAWVAGAVPVAQHPDLLRAGVVTLGAGALADTWGDAGASLALDPHPPVRPGTTLRVRGAWPGAPEGRSVRLELCAVVDAGRDLDQAIVRVPVDAAALRAGFEAAVPVPADAPPTMAADGLAVRWELRLVVDRPLRPDTVARRRLAIA